MVSLRSGKRTNRVSTGNVTTPAVEEQQEAESTPRRPARAKKTIAPAPKVFEEKAPSPDRESSTSSVEVAEVVESPAKQVTPSPSKKASLTPVKKSPAAALFPKSSVVSVSDSDDVAEDSAEGADGGDTTGEEQEDEVNEVEMAEEVQEPEVVVVSDEEVDIDKNTDEEVEEDADDDMPMEISSKKEAPKPLEALSESDDNDDEPMEVTSKVDPEVPQKSVVEQLLERKANKAAKLAEKKLKKRSKKKESKKIDEGFYEVKMKKSKAKFNVVTLKSGVQKMLEPEVNFREQLLQSRTVGSRVTNTNSYQHRAQWVTKRS